MSKTEYHLPCHASTSQTRTAVRALVRRSSLKEENFERGVRRKIPPSLRIIVHTYVLVHYNQHCSVHVSRGAFWLDPQVAAAAFMLGSAVP